MGFPPWNKMEILKRFVGKTGNIYLSKGRLMGVKIDNIKLDENTGELRELLYTAGEQGPMIPGTQGYVRSGFIINIEVLPEPEQLIY